MTLLLKAGATINNKSLIGSNAMGLRLSREHNSNDGTMFLFAAGEILDMSLSKGTQTFKGCHLRVESKGDLQEHLFVGTL